MPSLPTSLSVVALAVAWLVVLVPMAARRREHVPDSDDRSAGFRVLRRTSRRRNQRVLSRTAVASSDERSGGVDSMDDPTLWSEDDDVDRDETDELGGDEAEFDDDREVDNDEVEVGGVAGSGGLEDDEDVETDDADESAEGADLAESLYDADDDLDDLDDVGDLNDVEEMPRAAAREPVAGPPRTYLAAPPPHPDRSMPRDAADEWAAEHRGARTSGAVAEDSPAALAEDSPAALAGVTPRSDSGMSGDPGRAAAREHRARYEESDDDTAGSEGVRPTPDPTSLRRVPRRHGRGGFDPEAAAKAKAFRYRRRRRVAVVLLLAAVAFTLVSVFLAPTAWIGAVVSGALLVGYLAYLRRQVRIEEAIRQRRTARLARAGQLRPEYARIGAGEPAYQSDPGYVPGAQGGDDRHRRSTPIPATAQYPAGTVVDLDDDDPAFSDLDYHQPLTYRRASGQ